MDTENVRVLAARMASIADRVRELEARLIAQLAVTQWKGPDRERFDSDWESQHWRALREAGAALDDASSLAARESSDQDRAST